MGNAGRGWNQRFDMIGRPFQGRDFQAASGDERGQPVRQANGRCQAEAASGSGTGIPDLFPPMFVRDALRFETNRAAPARRPNGSGKTCGADAMVSRAAVAKTGWRRLVATG